MFWMVLLWMFEKSKVNGRILEHPKVEQSKSGWQNVRTSKGRRVIWMAESLNSKVEKWWTNGIWKRLLFDLWLFEIHPEDSPIRRCSSFYELRVLQRLASGWNLLVVKAVVSNAVWQIIQWQVTLINSHMIVKHTAWHWGITTDINQSTQYQITITWQ